MGTVQFGQFVETKETNPETRSGAVTVAVKVIVEPSAIFAVDALIAVVVEYGPPVLPPEFPVLAEPPPHPSAMLIRQTIPSANTARTGRFPAGKTSNISAIKPANPPKVHHRTRLDGRRNEGRERLRLATALKVLDGASVVIINVAVAGALLLSVTDDGETEQVVP